MARTAKKKVSIKDEGVVIADDVDSIDFTGGGVSGSAILQDVTEDIGGASQTSTAADGTSITANANAGSIVTQINTQAVGTLTINAPTGTPSNRQPLIFRIKSTNVQTFSWNAIFRGSVTTALPTGTSGGGLTDYFCFMYNSADSKWDFTGSNKGF